MSEPKGEPTRGVLTGADGVLAWLPAVELIGRSPVSELDLGNSRNRRTQP